MTLLRLFLSGHVQSGNSTQDVHSEDTGKEDKKVHTAVLKKSPFMKKLGKENPGKLFKAGKNVSIMEKIL